MFLLGVRRYFGPDRAQRSVVFLSFEVTDQKKHRIIYSVTICEQKTKDCAQSGSFQHKLQHHCFQL